jgi:methylglutaconyl-CoA hydratase
VRIGFLPAVVSVFLMRQIGEKCARDLLLTGRTIDAAEAHRIGLVTQIVPAKELMITAQILAATLLECSPVSLHMTKKLLCDFTAPEIARELELAAAASAQIRTTVDFQEGLASFLEKHPPRWGDK